MRPKRFIAGIGEPLNGISFSAAWVITSNQHFDGQSVRNRTVAKMGNNVQMILEEAIAKQALKDDSDG